MAKIPKPSFSIRISAVRKAVFLILVAFGPSTLTWNALVLLQQPPASTPSTLSSSKVGTYSHLYEQGKPYRDQDGWKKILFQRLDRIRAICGKLCSNSDSRAAWLEHSVPVENAGIRLTLDPDVNCPALMQSTDIDAVDDRVRFPPPDELLPYYTMGGSGGFALRARLKQIYLGKDAKQKKWTKDQVDGIIERIRNGMNVPRRFITYGQSGVQFVKKKLQELDIGKRKRVLVIGSEVPWVECICLALGAGHVTTLEYGTIVSEHPQISTVTPNELRQRYISQSLEPFDAIVTHSSVEHSGLGRYGDSLNPWADLLAIARAWCVATDEAVMYIGVPSEAFNDHVSFNAHRLYHKMRWSLLATNWVQIDGDRVPKEYDNGGDGALFRKVTNFDQYQPSGND